MAVFTKLNQVEIEKFLELYNIGKLENYYEIIEGIENTNYKIICEGKPYILTIFEKRVNEDDLPFFIDLKLYLNKNNFKCPKPITNKENKIINSIKNKKAVIVSFIKGKQILNPNENDCYEVGNIIGKLHSISKNFNKRRDNNLNVSELNKILNKCLSIKNESFDAIYNKLKNEIKIFENYLPENLPAGVIHADLFKDNIFFNEGKISGVIDFYFSCYHYYIYDISIVVNDWCFENNGKKFNNKFFKSIIEGYKLSRDLKSEELASFNLILRLAAVRILITRLHDFIFHPNDAVVIKKDPFEYLNILQWHQNNISI